MSDYMEGQVALLIDFENLIYGLLDIYDEDRLTDEVDINVLFKLAEEYGNVLIANAYADWRMRAVNQFQIELYRLGAELVHVLGRPGKNAVDVKMAVDAVEMLWTLPHIETFVIVSGDRDFIHVLKMLRRHGKQIIGVAPQNATSSDFAALCDRFLRYSALVATYTDSAPLDPQTQSSDLRDVRSALKRILQNYQEEGVKGAKIKPLLRRELSPAFDESEYGFSKMVQLLRSMPDVVDVKLSASGGDITVFPTERRMLPPTGWEDEGVESSGHASPPLAHRPPANGLPTPEHRAARPLDRDELIQQGGLNFYRFEPNTEHRRAILRAIFDAIRAQEPFTWREISDEVLETSQDPTLSVTVLSKYHTILWQSYAFTVLPDQDAPVKSRKVRLQEHLHRFDAFTRHFEESILFKVASKVNDEDALRPEGICALFGLSEEDPSALAYVQELIDSVREKRQRPIAT